MQRRSLITAAGASALVLALPTATAQVVDLSDAINKAGRQRMLSQRMGKAWLALLLNVEKTSAQTVLDKSIALFDRQLVELKAFAPNPEVLATYTKLESAWSDYKGLLVGKAPSRETAAALLQQDAKVLALAHQGTQQYEAALAKPVGKLVNIAGRQRMLSQRMAKFYLATTLPVDAATAGVEITKARGEFTAAMGLLKNAPEATDRIKSELALGEAQWVFFDSALNNLQEGAQRPRPMADVFLASENLLSVMDRVTGLYAAVKV
ncbi:type IV pili methyl-accepting chemotaxis transducer N-terminal domain-containing protein [Rhodoferax mekongensis]|uniref:Type IV pili methyl-accepting chemotaxis transducer N-terminal domain-containing protein n=1 Tax=Rhodoferax mekongensis TaxID=3068341 RepID=A0ABZ0AXK9_9BURK|nr:MULTISPECIES: type IV pili methyl-accepting chemotaxis transducer N-terminal domain-containing protein [unclassified Rhodoferax]MDT7514912.1 type IV pili methyl-accepting chemotaxis transducer N-terminal domain-containing protein [Rhodoferax sp. TBRC 17199]WNO04346.1 type IV pili methyl-accepting chemotaxis transducer N-terminal domain-containing protein [Rhodoferax sp. TBRC 17307]